MYSATTEKKNTVFTTVATKSEEYTNNPYFSITLQQYPPKSIVGRIVLPLVNDSITFGKDGLFYFHNEGKIGIFPRHTTVQYDEIKQHTRSFYHIVRDGRKGWLDIRTNWEYFEDLSQKHRIIRKQKNIVGRGASDSAGETKSSDVKSG